MITFEYVIKDENGLHARPAGSLVKLAKEFSSEIEISKGGKKESAKKLMMLMGMGISKGDCITVTVSGRDEKSAAESIKSYLCENL